MGRQAKFTVVAEELQQRIASGAYGSGQPLPTEEVLAKEFHVHRLTLRKAMDVLAKEQLVIRRQGCGTFANPSPRQDMLTSVLYVGETQAHFHSGFYQALCAEAQDRGKVVTSYTLDAEPRLEQLAELAERCRHLICQEQHWPMIREVISDKVCVTLVSSFDSAETGRQQDRATYLVSTDTYRAASMAVDHLVQLGHRHIAYVDYGMQRGADRFQGRLIYGRVPYLGYRSALFRADISHEMVIAVPDDPTQAEFQEWHYQCIRHHLRKAESIPTAFVCASDFRAGPLIRVLRELDRRVPDDASIVSIGNTPWAQWLDPPLTSVCLGETEMARLALILNAEPEPATSRLVRIDPHLVQRQSTAPAPLS